ncbi:MAG TPA: M14 family zinc carboxypeptidase [Candidatus Polarisedimenticolaceae bacterium]|nr:M14 family zinc carboxypeptidase [Candidatus Polarisedimenticolaceae bacterium]
MRRWTLLVALLSCATLSSAAPAPGVGLDRLFPGARFDPAVPTQESVVGFTPGSRPITYDELMRYVGAVAAASKRVKVLPYAKTYEDRELVVIAVGEESTIAGLDAFRDEHAKLTDPRRTSDAAVSGAKSVAWMAYGIHGNEISSTDAAAALLYWLAAGEDDRARAVRKASLVLIDPCENPDGRERALSQIRWFAHKTPTGDLDDLSHTAIWPYGRGNHYMFDMNRDWITLTQPESRRVAEIAKWNPQVMVDSHEMGQESTYLFSPARPPLNPFLPKSYLEQARLYAADQAKALDARSYPYYTREWDDEFFPGYGSSWAMYRGAVGILYEMSQTNGTFVLKSSGETRTYLQAVEHHVISSVANLSTLAASGPKAIAVTLATRRDGIERGTTGKVRAWVLPRGRFPDRTDALGRLLMNQGIEVQRLSAQTTVSGLVDSATGESRSVDLPAGSWLVPMDQPSGNLARAILDPHVPMNADFLFAERKSIETGKGTRSYDTTAWSLPLLFGVEAYWSATKPAGAWQPDIKLPLPPAGVEGSPAPTTFGWVFEGSSDGAGLAVADLLQAGVSLRLAEKPFRVDGREFAAGSILVKKEANGTDVGRLLDDVGKKHGIAIMTASTALAETGADLGGGFFHALAAPHIAVLTGPAVSREGYGAIWHWLDTVVGLRFSAIDLASLPGTDLRRYNVVVVPPLDWSASAVKAVLGKGGLDGLKEWVEGGGTLIGVGASELLADKDLGLTKARLRSQALDTSPPLVWSLRADEAEAAGTLAAPGLDAPEDKKDAKASPPKRTSPYDVAPVIGPGAKAFVEGTDIGTPLGGAPVDLDTWLKPVLPSGQSAPKDEDRRRVDDRLRRFAPQGALLRADVDPDLYLTWGQPSDLTVYYGADDALIVRPPVRALAVFSGIDTIQRGGLLWPEFAARLAKTAYASQESVGRGQVILFIDHPDFRGWTIGTRRLLLNALLYGPGVGAQAPAAW